MFKMPIQSALKPSPSSLNQICSVFKAYPVRIDLFSQPCLQAALLPQKCGSLSLRGHVQVAMGVGQLVCRHFRMGTENARRPLV